MDTGTDQREWSGTAAAAVRQIRRIAGSRPYWMVLGGWVVASTTVALLCRQTMAWAGYQATLLVVLLLTMLAALALSDVAARGAAAAVPGGLGRPGGPGQPGGLGRPDWPGRPSPVATVLGATVSGWLTALPFLLVAAPAMAWTARPALVRGGDVLVVLGTLAAIQLAVAGITAGWSSMTRPGLGVAASAATVTLLAIVLPVLFLVTIPFVTTEEGKLNPGDVSTRCEVWHTQWTWWLLAPSPLVITADATGPNTIGGSGVNPSDIVRSGVRDYRAGEIVAAVPCVAMDRYPSATTIRDHEGEAPVWPWGLAADLTVAAAVAAVGTLRLRSRYSDGDGDSDSDSD